jgi:deferrochelatase/peroxidase EfeB
VTDPELSEDLSRPLTRRAFFGTVGGVAVGGALAATGVDLVQTSPAGGAAPPDVEAFFGVHQGGIVTAPQRYSYFAAFDVTTAAKGELADLLRHWSAIASRLTQGLTAAPLSGDPERTEPDSGEALGLGAARLTINFGFGPTLFVKDGIDRYGLARHQPYELAELPGFPGDALVESRSGGDLTVHACADDPQVGLHAVRQLARVADGVASIRWSQSGFNETTATSGTPRNIVGFKDGTMNPRSPAELDQFVWVGYEGPRWMTGGTYLVVRRIQIALDQWDAQSLGTQEHTVGRHKISGAPLGRSDEFDALDLEAKDEHGHLAIPVNAHVRLASPEQNWGATILRRSYAYDDGVEVSTAPGAPGQLGGTMDVGLLFACYQRNPLLGFVAIFKKLAERDALRQFTTHTGSAIVAVPPAAAHPDEWVGQRLFAS